MGACGSKSASLSTEAVTVDVSQVDDGALYESSVDEKKASITASLVKQHVDEAKLEDCGYNTRGARVLGKGSYGVVTTCRRNETDDVFARVTHMVHSHTVRPPLGALLIRWTMCGTGLRAQVDHARAVHRGRPRRAAEGDRHPAPPRPPQHRAHHRAALRARPAQDTFPSAHC